MSEYLENMGNQLNTKEIQNVCLEIMEEFDRFANEHHLRYYLAGGTLLGAVRHGGFIPWDDDVDLMMPRSDYEQLINLYQDNRYILSCCEKDPSYGTPFARLWILKQFCPRIDLMRDR